jgi:hypothetical protein
VELLRRWAREGRLQGSRPSRCRVCAYAR